VLYTRLPTQQEAEAAGFSVADYEEEAEVWPENWPAYQLFTRMITQWRIGMGGRAGMDYLVLFSLLDRQGLSGDDWQQMFDDIRAMEEAALSASLAAA